MIIIIEHMEAQVEPAASLSFTLRHSELDKVPLRVGFSKGPSYRLNLRRFHGNLLFVSSGAVMLRVQMLDPTTLKTQRRPILDMRPLPNV